MVERMIAAVRWITSFGEKRVVVVQLDVIG